MFKQCTQLHILMESRIDNFIWISIAIFNSSVFVH